MEEIKGEAGHIPRGTTMIGIGSLYELGSAEPFEKWAKISHDGGKTWERLPASGPVPASDSEQGD